MSITKQIAISVVASVIAALVIRKLIDRRESPSTNARNWA